MHNLQYYFKDRPLLKKLARIRLRSCQFRHTGHFFAQTISLGPAPAHNSLPDIFPPRRAWHSHRSRYRQGKENVLEESLYRAMAGFNQRDVGTTWAKNLAHTVDAIRRRALGSDAFQFDRPKLRAEAKDRQKGVYRPIAVFAMSDNIVCSLVAKYWCDFFGPVVSKSCLSFGFGDRDMPPAQRNDGIANLLDYQANHRVRPLHVAEADIMACFDSVQHGVAWHCFQKLKSQAEQYHGHPADETAVKIMQAYLACYCFEDAIMAEADLRTETGTPRAHFKRPPVMSSENARQIGLPQGGALSGTFIHCVLHQADVALEQLKEAEGSEFLHLRFVDDMLLVSPDRATCELAYACYLSTLTQLHLPFHSPTLVTTYGADFWDSKSKAPFLWDASRQPGSCPWIRFLGYDLRADGMLRVSSGSVVRHQKKIDGFLRTFWRQLLKVKRLRHSLIEVTVRLRWHLVAMAIGRRPSQGEQHKISWTGSFPLLKGRPHVETQLRALDRFRERNVIQFRAKVRDRFGRSGPKGGLQVRMAFRTSYVAAFSAPSMLSSGRSWDDSKATRQPMSYPRD